MDHAHEIRVSGRDFLEAGCPNFVLGHGEIPRRRIEALGRRSHAVAFITVTQGAAHCVDLSAALRITRRKSRYRRRCNQNQQAGCHQQGLQPRHTGIGPGKHFLYLGSHLLMPPGARSMARIVVEIEDYLPDLVLAKELLPDRHRGNPWGRLFRQAGATGCYTPEQE